ncbi:MAG: DUF1835 domain-containing protein [Desulfobulbus sp.]|nr:DUF1835 domain-containing protein [Desulfobulbus sp.]
MVETLHITSGDIAGGSLAQSGLPGEVFVWHDILYDGPRCPGWPDEETLNARAVFLEEYTAGGLDKRRVLETLLNQYRKLTEAGADKHIVLWFDACLFDQSMLVHILTCLQHQGARGVELLCIDAFPGIVPFHGLGQMRPDQLASRYDHRQPVTDTQFLFAVQVDEAFATQEAGVLTELSQSTNAPLPWIPAAVTRWLQERPDPVTGLGRLEELALRSIRSGCETPGTIFTSVAAADTPPQFWGDITLWAKINGLAAREPPLVRINGPTDRLPQWESEVSLSDFTIMAAP